ncbi:MAG: hypothetical protein HZC47_05255 [Methanobacterium sp.]|uniref:hypothetical protein n=1 Tax=Methanobacterium sp. TaxID=2164 RepID=UPI003D652424|nr:hypothetical protein [Methanobacterium sp.]
MSFNLENLDEEIRGLMLEELDLDMKNKRLYLSERLNNYGKSEYPEILKNGMLKGNCETLAAALILENYWNEKEPRRSKKYGLKYVKVPKNAHETLAEGEFNRFYIRALCRKAIINKNEIEIYRAKQVRNPRKESQIIIGKSLDPKKLLEDLRVKIGVDTVLGMPPGPNSGLSIRIKK